MKYIEITNTRSIFVKYLAPTNHKGGRIKLIDKYRNNESKTFSYSYDFGNTLEQAVNILESNGAKIICRSSIPDYYIINIVTALKIIRSNKDFIFYRIEDNKIVDFTLTNDISRFRDKYNNKFKIVSDIKKQINNNLKIEL